MRQPAVANRFYPGSPDELRRTVSELLAAAGKKQKAYAVISPHAGYIYSGGLAGQTIGAAVIPQTVIILGPNHHGRGAAVAVSTTSWNMPMGIVPIDTDLVDALIAASLLLTPDDAAHQDEHSLEVQVPFLQAVQPDLHLVPIAVSQISYSQCADIASTLAAVISSSGKDVLILASTDMTHYESRSTATRKDDLALERIRSLDPEGLYQTVVSEGISMCGFIAVTIALKAALLQGATDATLVGYTDSGDISGDISQVVGYAGFLIS